jgi:hypothetical protein
MLLPFPSWPSRRLRFVRSSAALGLARRAPALLLSWWPLGLGRRDSRSLRSCPQEVIPRGLLCAVFGRPGDLPICPHYRGLLGTMSPSDSLVPSVRCCHRAYPSFLSGLTPLRFPCGRHLPLGRREDRGSPKVAKRTPYPHAEVTHAAAVSRTRLPPIRRGSPLRRRWTPFAFASACGLAVGPSGPGVSSRALPRAMGLVRLHPFSALLVAWRALSFRDSAILRRRLRSR